MLRRMKARRCMNRAAKKHDWATALAIAKVYGFETKWIALARITQLLNEAVK